MAVPLETIKIEVPNKRDEMAAFARKLSAQCDTHSQWLAVMRYGMGTLLENQVLLIELIDREAWREVARANEESAAVVKRIFSELGLRITTKD